MSNLPEKTEIRNAIEDYCSLKAISKQDLALQIGISGATLSNIFNNKWTSIDNKMWQKIWSYVRPANVANLFQTTDFASVSKLCKNAKDNHLMCGLIGDTGMGKTIALEATSRRENIFYIYYNSNMRPKHFFYELGKLLGYDFDGNMYDLVNRACETLNGLNNPLIIIDEASKLTDPMLLALHVLRDKTINNCGIVLSGMPYFKANLIKKANKQKVGISEFLRRIQIWHKLTGLTGSEIEFISTQSGISDKKEITRLKSFRRFADLANEILLINTISN